MNLLTQFTMIVDQMDEAFMDGDTEEYLRLCEIFDVMVSDLMEGI